MSTVSDNEQTIIQSLQAELRCARAELDQLSLERVQLGEALRSSEEFKSRLIACSRDCIKVLDLEARLLFMNQGGMQVLEICDIGPSVNTPWVDFWEGADRARPKQHCV